MAWVPMIVANRRNRYHRKSGAGIILGILIFFLMFGVMFFMFFDWRYDFFPPVWIVFSGFGGFLIIIGICLAITAITSHTHNKPIEKSINPYESNSHTQSKQINPYRIHSTELSQKEEPQITFNNQESPVVFENNYCRFCGAKLERDAVYCPQCGIKL